MRRVGITQRVDLEKDFEERRDSLDQAWGNLISNCDIDLIPIPNITSNVVEWAQRQELTGLLLSGGNDLAYLSNARNASFERDTCEKALLCWAENKRLPVLGVCRGMQIMNWYFGGSLSAVEGHVSCRHSVKTTNNLTIFRDYFEVNSFHNWGIFPHDLAASLEALVFAHDGTVEACRHEVLPWYGIMWHPERGMTRSKARDFSLLDTVFNANV